MSATTLSPHLIRVIRNMLTDKTPMAAIAREHNISVHYVRKIRDERTGTMTREHANLWVLGVFAKWNSARIDALEKEVNNLLGSDKPNYQRDTTSRLAKVTTGFIPHAERN